MRLTWRSPYTRYARDSLKTAILQAVVRMMSGPRAVGDVCHGVYLRYEDCRAESESDEDGAYYYCSHTGSRLVCLVRSGHWIRREKGWLASSR
jgi:hypothetical protein